jgi:hypothetical protein
MFCSNCNLEKEDYARMKVEIVDKKSKEIIEIMYGEIICIECLRKRYKERNRVRVYV